MQNITFNNFKENKLFGEETARDICDVLKCTLGKIEYSLIKEFFYHVCVDSYDYKILVTRRAYLLYRIFLNIFMFIEDERLEPGVEFEQKGKIFNSHSICLLNKMNLDNNKKFLIVDDIIVNGRVLSNTFEKMSNLEIDKNNVDIWCILCNSSAKCISKDVKDRLKTYRLSSAKKWRELSNCFTEIILAYKWGYTSYLSTYQIKKEYNKNFVNEFSKFLNEDENNIVDKNIQKYMEKSYIWFDDSTIQFSKGKENAFRFETYSIDCLRVYEFSDRFLIIPYIFLPSIETEKAFLLGKMLLNKYGIHYIPKVFQNINEDCELAALFLKWVINSTGKKIIENLISNIQFSTQVEITELPCDATYNFESDEIIKIADGNSILNMEIDKYAPENLNEYIDCFRKAVNRTLQEERIDLVFNSEKPTVDWIRQAVENYIVLERQMDSEKIKNKDSKYMGIRIRDAISIMWNALYESNINNEDLLNKAFKWVIKVLLSSFIYIWDIGESSYDVKPIYCGKQIVTGLTRHGEQSFRTMYRLYDDIYTYFYWFTKMTLEDRLEELTAFSRYLQIKLSNEKDKVEEFFSFVEKNVDYLFDVFVVEPSYDHKKIEIVKNYISCEYYS